MLISFLACEQVEERLDRYPQCPVDPLYYARLLKTATHQSEHEVRARSFSVTVAQSGGETLEVTDGFALKTSAQPSRQHANGALALDELCTLEESYSLEA